MVNNTGGLPQLGKLCVGLLLEVPSPPMHIISFPFSYAQGGGFSHSKKTRGDVYTLMGIYGGVYGYTCKGVG
jgi:hypothetical protein